jgi:hypothetical protein
VKPVLLLSPKNAENLNCNIAEGVKWLNKIAACDGQIFPEGEKRRRHAAVRKKIEPHVTVP